MSEKKEPKRCGKSIDGPKVGRHVVAWRKYCRVLTTHESGRCHHHRPYEPKEAPDGSA